MTLGITVFGIIQSHLFSNKLTTAFSGGQQTNEIDLNDPSNILTPQMRDHISQPVLEKITEALTSSLVQTFAWASIPAVIALAAAF
ncbi:hypothetical protein [Paenibacillus glycanilyticus]